MNKQFDAHASSAISIYISIYISRGEGGGVTAGDLFGGQPMTLRRVHDLQNVKFNRTHKCVAAILNAMRHKKEGSTFSPS